MTVEEMLQRITSYEIAEWQAYERHVGKLGPDYEREMLREIHYMLQIVRATIQAANTEKKDAHKIQEPVRVPGPNEFSKMPEEEEE